MSTHNQAGWTPIYDEIARKHGIVTAAVFGLIWRFCQMRERVCRASIANLAVKLGVNRLTVMRHIDLLLAEGLIRDMSPKLRNRPHSYVVTPQAARFISGGISRADSSAEDDCEEEESEQDPDSDEQVSADELGTSQASNVTISDGEPYLAVSESERNGSESDGSVSLSYDHGNNKQQPDVSESDLNHTLNNNSFVEEKKREEEEALELWSMIAFQLADQIDRMAVVHFLKPTRAISWDGHTLILSVCDERTLKWYRPVLRNVVVRYIEMITGRPGQLEIIIQPDD